MKQPAHNTEGVNRTKTVRFYPIAFTGKERDEETGYGYTSALGGRYQNHYYYDPLHRLTRAGGADQYGFEQAFELSPAGRPLSMSTNGMVKHYAYGEHTPPHAPQRIMVEDGYRRTLHDLRWDQAGNLGQVSTRDEHSGDVRSRFLYWTEDNRLHTVVDDRYHSYYAYDHAGERTLKIAGPCDALDVSAWVMHSHSPLQKFTLYPSPYVVVSDHGYTKHYYAGTERLAARVGGGFGKAVLHEQQEGITRQARDLFHQSLGSIRSRRPLAAPEIHREKHLEDAVFGRMADHISVPENLEAHVEIWNSNFLQSMRDLVSDAPEQDVYFYHSDHLGSASWITDANGEAVQHLQYLPYGEPFVNQRAAGSTYRERFTFTGKERDEETGYGYFGARYMDHELMTMWLSVDPMSDKYPSISPYAYCAWNPVRLVDPDGMEIGDYYNFNGTYLGWDGSYDDKVYIVNDSESGYNGDPNTLSPKITTTYSSLEAVQGVYNRTTAPDNKGIYEESAFVLGGSLASVIVNGKRGYYDQDGVPHCNVPVLTEEQKKLLNLGLTSVHSHPFELIYGISDNSYRTTSPSSDDKNLFESCDMNIIVGYLSNINQPSQAYPNTEYLGATFYSSSFEKIASLKMSSVNRIVANKQNAMKRHIGSMGNGL